MTKTFCDKCSKEILDDKSVRISFFGHTKEKPLMSKVICVCEDCYIKIDKKLNTLIFSEK